MKKLLVTALLTATVAGGTAQVKNQSHGYPIDPVPFTSVKVTDSFWGQRLNASREVTIPLAFSKCEETGRYTNFVNAAHPSDTIKVGGLAFDDTDVYKTIEGASYLLQTYPDKKLAKYIDSVLVIVAAAQEPDGYLYTSRTMNPKHPHEWAGSKRWEKVEDNEAYLNLDFEGNYSPLGSVFTWQDADPRFTDPHISLFAHNMPSGQMFGNLKQFEDTGFLEENPTFYLYTPERSKELCVIDVQTCHKADAIFQRDWSYEEVEEQTVTLATCVSYDVTPERLAVTGKVVREKLIL